MRVPVRPLAAVFVSIVVATTARGQGTSTITEGFDNLGVLTAAGWSFVNNSELADNTFAWRQGSSAPTPATGAFPPQAGDPGSYARSDYLATGVNLVGATVSDWMILPTRTLGNGATLTFYTRTNSSGATFPERLQVRLSTNGTSANVGTTPDSVGDFTTLLLDINPSYILTGDPGGYPTNWTQYTVTITGLASPIDGRVAIRHFMADSGPAGANGNQVGVDTLNFNPVPEPTGLLALGGLVVVGVRRRLSRRHRPAAAPASPESLPA